MKYAIIESGGKQYKVEEGKTVEVDLIHEEAGKKVTLGDVLLVSDKGKVSVGKPKVAGASVKATVVEEFKAPKILVFKYKSRQRYRVKQGHRQRYTRLMVNKIQTKSASKKKKADETKTEEK